MKKLTAVSVFLISVMFSAQGQDRAVIKGDTAYYKGVSFYPGKKVTIRYGSRPDKSWAFVHLGEALSEYPLPMRLANTQAVVQFHKQKGSKVYVLAKPEWGYRVSFDIEGAIDFKEIE